MTLTGAAIWGGRLKCTLTEAARFAESAIRYTILELHAPGADFSGADLARDSANPQWELIDLAKTLKKSFAQVPDFMEIARLVGADDQDPPGAAFLGGDLRNANFTQTFLQGAIFDRTNLAGAHFSNASLEGAVFMSCDLTGASFGTANASESEASLRPTDVCNVRFEDCTMKDADLRSAVRAESIELSGRSRDGLLLS